VLSDLDSLASHASTGLIPFFRTVVFELLRYFGVVFAMLRGDRGWSVVVQCGMDPGAIVEDLDIFSNRAAGVFVDGEHGAVDQLVLQRRKEGFGQRVVPALAG
jgi:hypothetical protein